MGISLLWLWDLSLVSGKLGNVELKEIRCPTRSAATELSNTNKAHCLFKGEERSVRLKSGSAVISGFLLSVLLLIHSSVGFWELACWPKQIGQPVIYGNPLSHAVSHSAFALLWGSSNLSFWQEVPKEVCLHSRFPQEEMAMLWKWVIIIPVLLWWTQMDPWMLWVAKVLTYFLNYCNQVSKMTNHLEFLGQYFVNLYSYPFG